MSVRGDFEAFAASIRGSGRLRGVALGALGVAVAASALFAVTGFPGRAGLTGQAKATVLAVRPATVPAARPDAAPAVEAEADEPETIRISGTVGTDLTQSLRAAGVPDAQGRDYVKALSTAIDLRGGLSIADRFDLVMVNDGGRPGELAYAGLDRIGRNDIELMKWTDGREMRWIDANTLGRSPEEMEMPVNGRMSSGFGERFHPILGAWRMHKGVDLAAPYGTPIVAAADGKVISAGWHGGYGNQVAIQHADGIQTSYGHMSRIAAAPGEMVRQGQVIGYVGSTGLATGPHVHYEVHRDGKLVNPLSVKLARSPLKGEEIHAYNARLRGLLLGAGRGNNS